jgi:hypothetical protein
MARYSKSIWPNMPTLIRAHPDYMLYTHRYLDGAWATYMWRRGDAYEYTRKMVAEAQKRDLSLVVGLNVLDGGNPTGTRMTAKELESWGSAMLSSSYPCAFVMWKYDTDYLTSSGVPSAMDVLRRKAANRSSKSCRS